MKMQKFLYIGARIGKTTDGGTICQKNMESLLQTIYGDCFHAVYVNDALVRGVKRIISYFQFTPNIDFRKLWKKIRECVLSNKIEIVFLCSSAYGVIAERIKRAFPNISVITFFHNIEKLYAKDYLSFAKPKSWYFYLYSSVAERKSVLHSDFILNINERDANALYEVYGRKSSGLIPFFLKNTFSDSDIAEKEKCKTEIKAKKALFVGSAFFGNTQGLDWFINSVLPNLSINLVIVGSGMDSVYKTSEKIEVHGFVDNLNAYYENADFVLLPIVSGSGMKTKTAEAMMHGKVIVGTTEAFSGYDTEGFRGLFCCNSVAEFENTVNQIDQGHFYTFNKEIYNHFCEHYSFDIAKKRMTDFLDVSLGGNDEK